MPIVWDERKRRLNIAKHGLDFALVEEGFDFEGAAYVEAREERMKPSGYLKGKCPS